MHYLLRPVWGGGIPILHPLTECMAANRIDEVYGILNGTTNYILTRMVRTGASFADALREAQEKGYAEANPTDDVGGIDAGRKICILADLAFGHQVDPDGSRWRDLPDLSAGCGDCPAGGIPHQTVGTGSPRAGRRMQRLCGAAPDPGGMAAGQRGRCVQRSGGQGNATGEVMFYGKGAGRMPTASACVADVMEALQAGPGRDVSWEPSGKFTDPLELRSRYYFRVESGSPA